MSDFTTLMQTCPQRRSDFHNEVQLFAVSPAFCRAFPLILSLSSTQMTEAQLEPVLPEVTAGRQVTATSSYTGQLQQPLPSCASRRVEPGKIYTTTFLDFYHYYKSVE